MKELPSNRLEWAKLNWKEAQHAVALLLNYAGFTKLEERSLGGGRADIIVTKHRGSHATIGIIEVKCYDKISPSIQKKAMIQACNYVSTLYRSHNQNQYWTRKQRSYFVAAVYTKDYPTTSITISNKDRIKYLPTKLTKIPIVNSSADKLILNLSNAGVLKRQTKLEDFF